MFCNSEHLIENFIVNPDSFYPSILELQAIQVRTGPCCVQTLLGALGIDSKEARLLCLYTLDFGTQSTHE